MLIVILSNIQSIIINSRSLKISVSEEFGIGLDGYIIIYIIIFVLYIIIYIGLVRCI